MHNELEKIDIIRGRFKVSYDAARDALADASGDVVSALAAIEKSESGGSDLLALGAELAEEVQKVVTGGPVRRLRIKYGNRVIVEKPLALTAIATLAVVVAAVLVTKLGVEVDRDEKEAARERP